MKNACRAALLLLAAGPLLASASRAAGSSKSPKVEKVIELLKALQSNLEADERKEQQMYDRYACWCEKITHQKATAITDAKKEMRKLGQDILRLKGKVATLTSEIAQLLVDIEENEKAQQTATEIRRKENEAFQAESMELKQALSALEKCIGILVAATMPLGAAMPEGTQTIDLVQTQSRAALAAQTLKEAVAAAPAAALGVVVSSERLSLLKSYADQLAAGKAGYTPQSLTIQGILKEMYTTFAEDLQTKMADESQTNGLFEDLMATKQKELLDMQDSVKKKTEEKAEAEVMQAEATQAYDDTEAQMEHDIEFFDATKGACSNTAEEWADRKAMRDEELQGIKKAIEILDTDDARQLFDDAIDNGHQGGYAPAAAPAAASLLQVESDVGAGASAARLAFAALKEKSSSVHSIRLARVAVQVVEAKAGHFDTVIAAIDKMIHDIDITEEQEDEQKIDQCKNQYTQINATMEDLEWKIGKNNAKHSKLTGLIRDMEKEYGETAEKINETEETVVELNATREQENQDYLDAKSDDNEAILLLQQARDALAEYYENQSLEEMETVTAGGEGRVTMFFQEHGARAVGAAPSAAPSGAPGGANPSFDFVSEQPPEIKFAHAGKRKTEAKGILAILDNIIMDLRGELALSRKQEAAAQVEHEKQVSAALDLIETLEERKTNLETAISNKKTARTNVGKARTRNQGDLQQERNYLVKIKPDCDWIIDNAPERRAKRRAEIDGLNAAKAYLVGYQEKSELGQDVGANQAQAGLVQGSQKVIVKHSADGAGEHGGEKRLSEAEVQKAAAETAAESGVAALMRQQRLLQAQAEEELTEIDRHQRPPSQAAALAVERATVDATARSGAAAASYDQLNRRETVLKDMFKKEEARFESHQRLRRAGAPVVAGVSMLQQHGGHEYSEAAASYDQLRRKETVLKAMFKKEEARFESRQKLHPAKALAAGASMLQEEHSPEQQEEEVAGDAARLQKKIARLQGLERQEREAFLQRNKH